MTWATVIEREHANNNLLRVAVRTVYAIFLSLCNLFDEAINAALAGMIKWSGNLSKWWEY